MSSDARSSKAQIVSNEIGASDTQKISNLDLPLIMFAGRRF